MESKKFHFATVEDWRIVRSYNRNFKTVSELYTHLKILSSTHEMAIKVIDDNFYIFMVRKEVDE